ncbi:MAG: hypothetical protein PHY72_01475 [Candidatus Pacebacteria bacterium]|nr:hypothetical protein [Candidatus Paceibacterota bacterium]
MKTILIVILAGLVIIAGAFYWYSWRPTQIRQECVDATLSGVVVDGAYELCLLRHGLEK